MTEKDPQTPKSANKIFDISKPGKSAPSASSKPIIITNRPVLQDPMMIDDSQADTPPSAPMVPSTKLKIQPIHDDVQPEAEAEATPSPVEANDDEIPTEKLIVIDDEPTKPKKKSTTKASKTKVAEVPAIDAALATEPAVPTDEPHEVPATEPKDKPAPGPIVPDTAELDAPKSEPKVETTPAAATDEPTESAESLKDEAADDKPKSEVSDDSSSAPADTDSETSEDKDTDPKPKSAATAKADEDAVRKQAERAAEIEKVVESRKYYLPIDQVGKRKNKHYAILGLAVIILLAAAWADIALDAGIVHVSGVKPLTHFFSK